MARPSDRYTATCAPSSSSGTAMTLLLRPPPWLTFLETSSGRSGVLSGSDLVALHSQGPEPPWAYVSLSVRRGERKLNVEAVVPAQLAEKLAPRLVGRCV